MAVMEIATIVITAITGVIAGNALLKDSPPHVAVSAMGLLLYRCEEANHKLDMVFFLTRLLYSSLAVLRGFAASKRQLTSEQVG